MKYSPAFLITLIVYFMFSGLQADASGDFAYGRHPQLTYYITPDTPEIHAGEVATFTITVKNRSDKPFRLLYNTGQQWDLAVFHNKTQLFRWSQGLTWEERAYSVPLRRGETKTKKISWRSVNKWGEPLPQGVYSARGMVLIEPKTLVTEDCFIRLLPPKVESSKTIKVKINMLFEIELPRYARTKELSWKIRYKYNDNRVDIHKLTKTGDKVKVVFHPKRYGHVEFDFYGYPETKNVTEAIERRSFRVEITDNPD